jgi:hypothetical protein
LFDLWLIMSAVERRSLLVAVLAGLLFCLACLAAAIGRESDGCAYGPHVGCGRPAMQ